MSEEAPREPDVGENESASKQQTVNKMSSHMVTGGVNREAIQAPTVGNIIEEEEEEDESESVKKPNSAKIESEPDEKSSEQGLAI